LYVEELLRRLQETGGVVIEEKEARLGTRDVLIPMSIHDIIAARIDQLNEPVKHTLQVAAVVGREVPVAVLARTMEMPEMVPAHLAELRALDFVFPKSDGADPVETFKHALTQEVAYGGLLERRRRFHPGAVGAALEALHADRLDEVVELLALHYGRSGDDEKAVDYAIRAAEKAQRRWADTEALAQFDAALKRLEAMDDSPPNRLRRIDAVVKQAEIKFALGRHAEHVEALEAIRELVDAEADPPRRAAWYCWTGFLRSLTGGRPEVPLAYCREASTIAEAHDLDEIRAIADCCLTHVAAVAGHLREAMVVGARALDAFEARANTWWTCRTLWVLSMAANASGEWNRSLEYCRRALELGRLLDDLRLKVVGWWRTGSTHVQRGDIETGLRCYEEALALAPIPFDRAMVRAGQAYGLVKAGRVAAGVEQLAEAVEWFERSNLRYTRCSWALRLAEGHLALGDGARARALVEEVLAFTRVGGYRHLEGVAARLLGTVLVDVDPAVAEVQLDAAIHILEEVGARDEVARGLVSRAGLRENTGDYEGARDLLTRALTLFEELGTLDEPRGVRAPVGRLAGLSA